MPKMTPSCIPFQSSPSPKAGSYRDFDRQVFFQITFQSSPSPKAGSYPRSGSFVSTAEAFQSSPSPKAGSYQIRHEGAASHRVSILSQPEGRELPWNKIELKVPSMFQSSPSPKAGSYAQFHVEDGEEQEVSILSQPEGRELPDVPLPDDFNRIVSILSQPEGRELHNTDDRHEGWLRFQSSPSPKAGSYLRPT